jgi:bifunctional UDP-N-acetylglucosamine pyrophosphorylase/glucosamine-1-phosphate N-acetyltransferase
MNVNDPLGVVILAAGKGTRMYSDIPKVLHPLAGKPLLKHVLDTARQLRPDNMIVVYGHGGDAVPLACAAPDIAWAEQVQQLGTGHALRTALPRLTSNEGVVLVLYGDVPLIRRETLSKLVELADGDSVALLTMALDEPHGYGRILRNKAGAVFGIVEEKDADEGQKAIREVNTGIMALPASRLEKWLSALRNDNRQSEYYLTDVIALAVADGARINTCQPDQEWEILGINSKAQLAQLERIHQQQIAGALLAKGVTLIDPARLDVRGELVCGRDVVIDANCIFEGRVELADGATIGAHCVLREAKIGPGCTIEPFSLIEKAEVGANCKIGPYARIRPGTVLDREVHVGNFVELKNAQVAEGSKINHLSYVGDSTVGRKVNIGAGTITCNYDGAHKHRTIIEDDVFIGSDTQLVAPVTVKKGSTIGAGSTITKDAPEGELTLSRSKQITVSGWKRPTKNKQG